MFTIRPGAIKGWGHAPHPRDRYALLFGEMEIVCFDARETRHARARQQGHHVRAPSPPRQRPAGVWHANRNIGSRDVVVVNFPTTPYDHEHPDKERLPLDTPFIPYSFEDGRGW